MSSTTPDITTLGKPIRQPILVVVQQKGSNEAECQDRVMYGHRLIRKLTKNFEDVRFMIVGGANNGVPPETLKRWIPNPSREVLLIKNEAGNTREKAVLIAEYVEKEKIETIFHVTSLYHSLRAYLTTQKALVERSVMPKYFYNAVCDMDEIRNIDFALRDEFQLIKKEDDSYKESKYASALRDNDTGLRKYFDHRYGEAAKIVAYSSEEKNHLSIPINIDGLLETYLGAHEIF